MVEVEWNMSDRSAQGVGGRDSYHEQRGWRCMGCIGGTVGGIGGGRADPVVVDLIPDPLFT